MKDFSEIVKCLEEAQTIAIYPHVNMDGDALGSAVALTIALREMGKRCHILITEKVPDNLAFMDNDFTSEDLSLGQGVDVSLLVDCGELKRIKGREEAFMSGKTKLCIDHHGTTEPFCDYNYIDSDAAATGQIVFKLMQEMGVKGTKEMGEALFCAITTDTGDFQYSNTQKESHEIVAKLYDWGIDSYKVSVAVYESNRLERLIMSAKVIGNMKIFAEGKAALAFVTQDILRETGARMEETEWIAGDLRSIKGVEVAILLKEEEDGAIKCSLRSKEYFDVARLAQDLGGGGHIRASGYTTNCTMEEAIAEITEAVTAGLLGDDN